MKKGILGKKRLFLSYNRSRVVTLSLENESLIDARFNHLVQAKEEDDLQVFFSTYFGQTLTLEEHIHYKYQLLIDGNSSAWMRGYWQMFSNCVIFKQESPYSQWYYNALEPYVHYVPVNYDMSNLVEKVLELQDDDELALKISKNQQTFAYENLTYARMLQYIYVVLKKIQTHQ